MRVKNIGRRKMQDRFRFRLWNEKTKTMIKDIELTQCRLIDYILQGNFMQCTGIKDINGDLIFEGDIVRCKDYPFNMNGADNYHAEIIYSDKDASFYYWMFRCSNRVSGISTGNTGSIDEYKFEIIGNIYEDTNLKYGE